MNGAKHVQKKKKKNQLYSFHNCSSEFLGDQEMLSHMGTSLQV